MPEDKTGFRDVLSSLPNFALAAAFFMTWWEPSFFGKKMVASLMLVMLMEFINIHSSAFMGNVIIGNIGNLQRTKRIVAVAGLGVFYTLFVGGFCMAFHETWPLFAFWGLTLNRLAGLIIGQVPEGREKEYMQTSWAGAVFFYIIFIFLTVILPVPQFGITQEVVKAQEFTVSGIWIEQPQRMIAAGFLYFLCCGWLDLNTRRFATAKKAT